MWRAVWRVCNKLFLICISTERKLFLRMTVSSCLGAHAAHIKANFSTFRQLAAPLLFTASAYFALPMAKSRTARIYGIWRHCCVNSDCCQNLTPISRFECRFIFEYCFLAPRATVLWAGDARPSMLRVCNIVRKTLNLNA